MSRSMSVRVTGVDELLRNVERFREDCKREIERAARESAEVVANKARGTVRRKSGLLASSIMVDTTTTVYGNPCGVVKLNPALNAQMRRAVQNPGAGGRSDAYYPALLEFGGTRQRAFPFMRPALDGSRAQTKDKMRGAVNRAIERAGG